MRALVPCLMLLAAAGCRDGVAPFTPPERQIADASMYALTFGIGNDADPRWSPGGDTLLYHTNLFGTLPQARGILLGIAAGGGSAVPSFGEFQSTIGRPLATPAYSPTGDRIAFMDLMSVDVPSGCAATTPMVSCADTQPLLDSAVLRVRRVDEQQPVSQDPSLPVRFAGTDPAIRAAAPVPYFDRLYPFQEQHRTEGSMLFRPAWSPDGQRIAFSDGLSIRIWQIGQPTSSIVPGTEDGVSAAWSPDGEWLAFTVLERADSQVVDCNCPAGRDASIPLQRYTYTIGARTLVIVRPDGSDRTEIGAGEDPAWSPDNQFIYARRDNGIVRVAVQGGAAVPVADTDRGRSPAVSPDGTRLAFARRKDQATFDYDIWIASLVQ